MRQHREYLLGALYVLWFKKKNTFQSYDFVFIGKKWRTIRNILRFPAGILNTPQELRPWVTVSSWRQPPKVKNLPGTSDGDKIHIAGAAMKSHNSDWRRGGAIHLQVHHSTTSLTLCTVASWFTTHDNVVLTLSILIITDTFFYFIVHLLFSHSIPYISILGHLNWSCSRNKVTSSLILFSVTLRWTSQLCPKPCWLGFVILIIYFL